MPNPKSYSDDHDQIEALVDKLLNHYKNKISANSENGAAITDQELADYLHNYYHSREYPKGSDHTTMAVWRNYFKETIKLIAASPVQDGFRKATAEQKNPY